MFKVGAIFLIQMTSLIQPTRLSVSLSTTFARNVDISRNILVVQYGIITFLFDDTVRGSVTRTPTHLSTFHPQFNRRALTTCCCTSTSRLTSMTSRVTTRWPTSTATERWPSCPTHNVPARWPCSAVTDTSRYVTMFLPQYCLASVVTWSPRLSRSVPLPKSLHWLTVHYRINFKFCTIAYQPLSSMQPAYTWIRSSLQQEFPASYAQPVVTFFTFLGRKSTLEPSRLPQQMCKIRYLLMSKLHNMSCVHFTLFCSSNAME